MNVSTAMEEAPETAPWLEAPQSTGSPARPTSALAPQALAAAEAIQEIWPRRPELAIVLGTGLGHLASLIEAEATIPYEEIPGFPRCTALAHKGHFVAGRLGGVPIVAMQGRCHLYEGHSLAQVMLPTFVLRALGAKTLLLTNAAGAVNPRYKVGDVMVIEDHLNMMFAGPAQLPLSPGEGRGEGPQFPAKAPCYCPRLLRRAQLLARRENLPLQTGVYVGVIGPNYETRAEYRFFRKIGGDAVGMSTVPEALAARACGLKVLALSTITNVARPDAPQIVDMHDVVSVAERAEPVVRQLVSGVVETLC
jgi:purine-nucleoside phosphorylase